MLTFSPEDYDCSYCEGQNQKQANVEGIRFSANLDVREVQLQDQGIKFMMDRKENS